MRFLKFILGLLLLPLCWAATRTLIHVVADLAPEGLDDIPVETWWLLGGFSLWLILYLVLPRPFRTYVLAHELTHAFWGYLMGARVSGLRVESQCKRLFPSTSVTQISTNRDPAHIGECPALA